MSYSLIWDNNSFPKDLQVYQITVDGLSKERDVKFEEEMRSKKSILSLMRDLEGVGLQIVDQIGFDGEIVSVLNSY